MLRRTGGFRTAGVGSVHHVAAIYFQNRTDTRFGLVPYRGGAPALQDLVAGQIDLIISPAADAIELIRAGTIKAFAIMAKNRLAAAPIIPNTSEAGFSGLKFSQWYAFFAPKSTAKIGEPLAYPRIGQRDCGRCIELADAGGARYFSESRNRKMVANY
jgi:tripartite-type tricarboxylate transporter receptor subunit TctC